MVTYGEHPEYFMHKAVLLEYGKEKAWIDELLAPVILSVWKLGFRTIHCCQEPTPGVTFICFEDRLGMELVIAAIARLSVERGPFDRVNETEGKWEDLPVIDRQQGVILKQIRVRGEWSLGYKDVDLPVWTKNLSLQFPIDYLPALEQELQTLVDRAQ